MTLEQQVVEKLRDLTPEKQQEVPLIAVGPPEWFINWPVMFVTALALYGVLRSLFAVAPFFLRKLTQLGMATCLVMG